MSKEFYIDVKGGLGYNLSLARVLHELESNDYKFYVRSPYYDVFASTNAVEGYYKPEEIRDFIFDAKAKGAEIIEHRLYDMGDFIYKKLNYRDAWLKLLGIKQAPVPVHVDYLDKLLVTYPNLTSSLKLIKDKIGDSDFIITQFCGGQSPLDNPQDGDWTKKPYEYEHEPLKRHYPTELAQEFVKLFKAAHTDTKIVQYCLPNEPRLEGCESFLVPYLTYYLLAKDPHCKGFVSIDSSLQHLITGLTKGVVIWGHSLPENFGYDYNENIVQTCRRDDILYFTELGASGAHIDYIKPKDLFDIVEKRLYATKDD